MADIEVQVQDEGDSYACTVDVVEGQNSTHHEVTLDKKDYRRLTDGRASPEELVRASFEFLLEREPKESILRNFNLMLISRYFPEYERQIQRKL